MLRKFLLSHKTLLTIDESTTIKNPKALRTKNIIQIADMAKYRRILTGSPVTKNPLDLFSQCFFLDPYHLDHQSYYSFRTRYAIMKTAYISGRSIQLVSGFKHLAELAEKLKPFSYRVLKEDCLDLPPKIYMKRNIELSAEQKKVYKEMKEKALANLPWKTNYYDDRLTQLMRLQQITCGHFVADDGTTQKIKSNRLDELMDILDEVEGKAIIWAHWQADIKNIIKEIKKVHGPGPWSIIMDSRPRINGTNIARHFRMILKYAIWWEHRYRWIWYYASCGQYRDLLFQRI